MEKSMKQKRKVKGQKFTESNKFLASLLVLLWGAFCMGALSLFTVPNVWWQTSLTTLSYTWLESKNEVVYDMFFIDKGNQEIINEIYMKKDGDNRNFYISWNSVVLGNLLPNYEGLDKVSVLNLVWEGKYSNILWWDHNNINSSNITIIAGISNAISEWNDNATIVWSAGSSVSTWGGNVPLVLVWWSNNEIGSNQNGTVIIWWNWNKIFDNVSNSQILGWNGNKVAVDNVIVAWNNVEATPSGEWSFVFNWYSTEVFRPNSTNSFFLNVEKGVWLNMEASNGGLASKWAISIGEIDKSMCTSDNIWMQWVWSGCLVWCTEEWTLELLDTSEWCLESSDDPYIPNNAWVCYFGWVDTGNATICGDPAGYINAIFEVELIDANRDTWITCPNEDNQCVYQCNYGYHLDLLDGKCHKDCDLPWNSSEYIRHGKTVTWYSSSSTTCTNTCSMYEMILTCNDGVLYDSDGRENKDYTNEDCVLNDKVCSATTYPFTSCPENGICEPADWWQCDEYQAKGKSQCIYTGSLFQLTDCKPWYTFVDEGWVRSCKENCTYKSYRDTGHWKPQRPYHNGGGMCSSDSDGCSTYLVTCNNGTWKIWNWNINAGTLITSCWWEGQPCELYNISESEMVEWKVYSSCPKFSGWYSCTAWDVVYQEWEGCAAWYWQCGWDCIADCGEWEHADTSSCSCVDETYSCGWTEPSWDGVSKWSSSYTEWHTPTSWTYKSSWTLWACQWRCSDGYEQSGNGCKEKEKSICALSCWSVFDNCRVDWSSVGNGSNQGSEVSENGEWYYTWTCFWWWKPSWCDEVDPTPPLSCRCDTKTCSDYGLSSTNPGNYESVTKDSWCGSDKKITCYKEIQEYDCQWTEPWSYTTKSNEAPTSNKNWEYKSSWTLWACQWRCNDGYERDWNTMNCKPDCSVTCGSYAHECSTAFGTKGPINPNAIGNEYGILHYWWCNYPAVEGCPGGVAITSSPTSCNCQQYSCEYLWYSSNANWSCWQSYSNLDQWCNMPYQTCYKNGCDANGYIWYECKATNDDTSIFDNPNYTIVALTNWYCVKKNEQYDPCADYPISWSCPAHGECVSCPTDSNRKKLTKCHEACTLGEGNCEWSSPEYLGTCPPNADCDYKTPYTISSDGLSCKEWNTHIRFRSCRSGYEPSDVDHPYNCVSKDPCKNYTYSTEQYDWDGNSCCFKCTNSSSSNYGKYKCTCTTPECHRAKDGDKYCKSTSANTCWTCNTSTDSSERCCSGDRLYRCLCN